MLGADLVKVQVDLSDITKHVINVFWGIKPEDEPLRPEGASILNERERAPADRPLSHGPPNRHAGCHVYLRFQDDSSAPGDRNVVRTGDLCRQIYTDGRSLPKQAEPSWMGYSVGKWEGDTLVLETTGLRKGARSTF